MSGSNPVEDIVPALRRAGTVFCRLPGQGGRWGLFQSPEDSFRLENPEASEAFFAWLQDRLDQGRHLGGFISYEAGPLFDPAIARRPANGFPLAWMAAFPQAPRVFPRSGFVRLEPGGTLPQSFPEISEDAYVQAVRRVLDYIAAGDIYQANYTFKCRLSPLDDPAGLFVRLLRAHPAPYAAFVNTGTERLASLSPELFLERVGDTLRSKPMKGTAPREADIAADRRTAAWLGSDSKNRAENVMITDMVRNDFGKICVPGSIAASPLFQVETYPSVHQMTSTVSGRLRPEITLRRILEATFPAASITGAPKVRATEIIAELEPEPRGVYTGTIGAILPGGDFCLNVAIRTLVDGPGGVELAIGSGIVADSVPADEWRECLLKSQFSRHFDPDFDCLETLLWERGHGYGFLDAHLARLRGSLRRFDRPWRRGKVFDALASAIPADFDRARVRLLVDASGEPRAESYPLAVEGWGKPLVRAVVSITPTDSGDLFLRHKTTRRALYDREYKAAVASGFDETLFANQNCEVTEGAISNVFIETSDGVWLTAPVEAGLLPGVWRAQKLKELRRSGVEVSVRRFPLEALFTARRVVLGNSVRGEVAAVVAEL